MRSSGVHLQASDAKDRVAATIGVCRMLLPGSIFRFMGDGDRDRASAKFQSNDAKNATDRPTDLRNKPTEAI